MVIATVTRHGMEHTFQMWPNAAIQLLSLPLLDVRYKQDFAYGVIRGETTTRSTLENPCFYSNREGRPYLSGF